MDQKIVADKVERGREGGWRQVILAGNKVLQSIVLSAPLFAGLEDVITEHHVTVCRLGRTGSETVASCDD